MPPSPDLATSSSVWLVLYDTDGHRIARSTLLADALRPGVSLVFNGVRHPVVLPTLEERTLPLRSELGSLQTDFDKLQELKNVCDKAAESVRPSSHPSC